MARLQLRVARHVDLLELEAELLAEPDELVAGPLAQMAPVGVEERDVGYGYSPRVTVASATRCTAMP